MMVIVDVVHEIVSHVGCGVYHLSAKELILVFVNQTHISRVGLCSNAGVQCLRIVFEEAR